ncbi:MAG: folate-binding protein [Pseudomonadota bacterium]
MADMIGLHDTSRIVLRMAGVDARAVLQGVVTNDVDLVGPGHPVYAALLTPQGKYLSDFLLLDGGEGAVLIDVARDQAAGLAQRLKMYGLRRDAVLSVEEACEVALVWAAAPGAETDSDVFASLDEGVLDPRDPGLGHRRYGPDAEGWLAANGVTAVSRNARDALRVSLMVPETGIELVPDETYVLEAGFERLSGVDFSKGCYVGQEVTARMKHKTELRKGLVRVQIEGEAEPGTPVTSGGKPAGTIYTQVGGEALAHLRLDRAGPEMQAGDARVAYEG